MSWYSTGTVNVTSGSPNIVGVGTTWAEHVSQGWAFYGPDKELYEVLSVNNNTSITLARNYAGSTLSGQAYQLIPTQGETRALTARVLQLLQDVANMLTGAGAGKFPDGAVGTPSVAAASVLPSGENASAVT
ncbi:MAG TPA: hypothetical protein PLZ93_16355, partial [Nocardioides sp.]|nr:hypothetical protein [Nocardioides sp.]